MGAAKQQPKLEVIRDDFGQATHDLATAEAYLSAPPELKALIDRLAETAINAVEASQVAIEQPRSMHTHSYGPKIQHDQHNEIAELGEFNGHKTEHHQHNTLYNQVTARAYTGDWIYWASPDLIISTNGNFVFRPKSKKLILQVGEIELTDSEVTELFRVLKEDFNLRGKV